VAEITTTASRTRSRKSIVHLRKGGKRSLSGYLSGEDFERYYFSKSWVFPGWIGFSQWIKKEFCDYPKREMLVELAKMSKAGREEDTWLGLYLWEKKGKMGGL